MGGDRMVWVEGVGRVRKGSYSTKNDFEKWRWVYDRLTDRGVNGLDTLFVRATALVVNGLDPHADSQWSSIEYYLRDLRDTLDAYLGVIEKAKLARQLRVVDGRTPEEARNYLAKAEELEKELEGWRR